jgi:hypothetical protein
VEIEDLFNIRFRIDPNFELLKIKDGSYITENTLNLISDFLNSIRERLLDYLLRRYPEGRTEFNSMLMQPMVETPRFTTAEKLKRHLELRIKEYYNGRKVEFTLNRNYLKMPLFICPDCFEGSFNGKDLCLDCELEDKEDLYFGEETFKTPEKHEVPKRTKNLFKRFFDLFKIGKETF